MIGLVGVVAAVIAVLIGYQVFGGAKRGASRPNSLRTSAPHVAAAPSTAPGLLPPLPRITGPAHDDTSVASTVGSPVRLTIPAIGVDANLERLDRNPDGTLEAPTAWDQPGWYADGTRPGELGPAVIAGHVDSTTGPAVFFRLRALKHGDSVVVTDSHGRQLRFVVERAVQYPKTTFPTAAVYGPSALPELRLITCSGDFDSQTHNYVDNLVVYADLASAVAANS